MPTQKEQAQARHAERYRAKYGKDPIFPTHQTTANNRALHAFDTLLHYVSREDPSLLLEERLHRAYVKAASEVMNGHGHPAFMDYVAQVFGLSLDWDDRAEHFRLEREGEWVTVRNLASAVGEAQAQAFVREAGKPPAWRGAE